MGSSEVHMSVVGVLESGYFLVPSGVGTREGCLEDRQGFSWKTYEN